MGMIVCGDIPDLGLTKRDILRYVYDVNAERNGKSTSVKLL